MTAIQVLVSQEYHLTVPERLASRLNCVGLANLKPQNLLYLADLLVLGNTLRGLITNIEQLSSHRVHSNGLTIFLGEAGHNSRLSRISLHKEQGASSTFGRTSVVCIDELGKATDRASFRPVTLFDLLCLLYLGQCACGLHDTHLGDLFNKLVADCAFRPERAHRRGHVVFRLTIE